MAKDEQAQKLTPKQRAAKKRRNMIIFIVELLILAVVVVGVIIVVKFTGSSHTNMETGLMVDDSSFDTDVVYYNPDIVDVDDKGNVVLDDTNAMSNYYQIALFGVDSRSKNLSKGDNRSDTIIIACVDKTTKEVKLCSVYRDTYLNLGNDKYGKCNGAFAAGGPTNAITMLNMNLDIAVTDYVVVGFTGLIDIIDALGGVWVDVQENEIKHLNNYQISMVGTTTDDKNFYATPGVDYTPVENAGYQLLNGLQATAFCRIRYVGSDFGRTERQRTVIEAAMEQAKKMDASSLIKILNSDVFKEFDTSLDIDFISDVLTHLGDYKIIMSEGFPSQDMLVCGNIGSKGSCVVPVSLESNVEYLHKLLFNDETYTATEAVKKYSTRVYEDTISYLK